MEVDFPRGGVDELRKARPRTSKRVASDYPSPKKPFRAKKHKYFDENEDVSKNDNEFSEVWRQLLKPKDLTEGLLGLGIVRKVFDLEVFLETADGGVVCLPATNISPKLVDAMKDTPVALQDLFTVGQMIAFKVVTSLQSLTSREKKHSKKKKHCPVVSCAPAIVNSHLGPSNIMNGLVLNGSVESVEEKGVIINLGFHSKNKGFLSFSELPAETSSSDLVPGQVLLVRINDDRPDLKTVRVIRLSGVPEAETLSEDITSKLKLNQLMPGTALLAAPLKSSRGGCFVNLGNDVRGFLRASHMPKRLRNNFSRFVEPLRCVVTFCQQNSQILSLSALPEVVALSRRSYRTAFNEIKVGDIISCTVTLANKRNVYFDVIVDENGKKAPFTANEIINKFVKAADYAVGSNHLARVLGYNYFQRQILVSTQSSILKQKFVSVEDAVPGKKVKAKVVQVKAAGVFVKVYKFIPGFIPLIHLGDKRIHKADKYFKPKQIIECRVLYADIAKSRLVLTHRPSLLNSKNKVISDYSLEYINATAIGVVAAIQSNGGLVITFFGRVGAYMFPKEASRFGNIKVGSTVRVRVLKVDQDARKMLVGFDEPSITAEEGKLSTKETGKEKIATIQRSISNSLSSDSVKKTFKKKVKPFTIYPAKVLGLWTKEEKSDCAVELELPYNTIGRLHGCELDGESLASSAVPVKTFVDNRKGQTILVKVIGFSKAKEKVQEGADLAKATKIKTSKDAKIVTRVLRIVDCTVVPQKLSDTRKKMSCLGYRQSYTHGEHINVFVKRGPHLGSIHVEASPLWNGVIEKQNLGDVVNETDKKSSLIDVDFEPGQVLQARVIGINEAVKKKSSRRRKKCLRLSLLEGIRSLKENDKVIGRVTAVTKYPSSVTFQLSNGQRAILTPTGVSSRYLHSLDRMQSYSPNEVYYLRLLRFYEKGGYWFVVTESRFKSFHSETKRRVLNKLITSHKDIEKGDKIKGFINRISNGVAFAEIGPGIYGRVMTKEAEQKFDLDQLISMRVSEIFKSGHLNLLFSRAVTEATEININETTFQSESKKRSSTLSSKDPVDTPSKKSTLAGFKGPNNDEVFLPEPVLAKIEDPGFDWSLQGYTAADFASVSKIGKNVDFVNENPSVSKTGNGKESIAMEDNEEDSVKTPKSKQEKEILKEKELLQRENALLAIHENPTSENHFDLLVTGNPNSSELWIRYMAFFISRKDIEQAREIAERALDVINYREEEEIYNVWTAYLNLESAYGSSATLKSVFGRAIQNTDSLKMHKQMLKIYQKAGKVEESDELLEMMIKKFRHEDLDVWVLYGQHLMDTKRAEKARSLLKRALTSLQPKNHVSLLCRFAQLEYKSGDPERGKTIFESILSSYPKKTDVWVIYTDLAVKNGTVEEARQLFERVTAVKLSTHKMRQFFKKWMTFEEKHGTEETKKLVRRKAAEFIDDVIPETEK